MPRSSKSASEASREGAATEQPPEVERFSMRALADEAPHLPELDASERKVVGLIGDGVAPREVAERLGMDEPRVYRLVVDVLNYLEPPGGPTHDVIHEVYGGRSATAEELEELERIYGPSQPPDDEG